MTLVPELHESHQFAVLIAAESVGVGVARAAAFFCSGMKKVSTLGPASALQRQVVAVERYMGRPGMGSDGSRGRNPSGSGKITGG